MHERDILATFHRTDKDERCSVDDFTFFSPSFLI